MSQARYNIAMCKDVMMRQHLIRTFIENYDDNTKMLVVCVTTSRFGELFVLIVSEHDDTVAGMCYILFFKKKGSAT